MRVLVVGAGVIGSFSAAAGVDVRLLARGQRLAALREHGVSTDMVHGVRRFDCRQANTFALSGNIFRY